MCLATIVNPVYLTLGPGTIEWVILILLVGGIGGGAWTALPAAMKADVVDIDRLASVARVDGFSRAAPAILRGSFPRPRRAWTLAGPICSAHTASASS